MNGLDAGKDSDIQDGIDDKSAVAVALEELLDPLSKSLLLSHLTLWNNSQKVPHLLHCEIFCHVAHVQVFLTQTTVFLGSDIPLTEHVLLKLPTAGKRAFTKL